MHAYSESHNLIELIPKQANKEFWRVFFISAAAASAAISFPNLATVAFFVIPYLLDKRDDINRSEKELEREFDKFRIALGSDDAFGRFYLAVQRPLQNSD